MRMQQHEPRDIERTIHRVLEAARKGRGVTLQPVETQRLALVLLVATDKKEGQEGG